MRLIKRGNLEEAAAAHPEVQQALADWVAMVRAACWSTPTELLSSARFHPRSIGNNRVIFKIKGNDFRLICAIRYADPQTGRGGIVMFKFFGTHGEYDQIDALTVEHDG